MKQQQQRQAGFEVSPTMKHGPVSGPANGGLTALMLTVVIWSANRLGDPLPVWLPLAIAAVGSGVATAVTVLKHSNLANLYFRVACWVGGGAWSFLALTAVRHNFLLMLIILAVGTFVAGLFLQVFAPPESAVSIQDQPVPGMTQSVFGAQDEWAEALQWMIPQLIGMKGAETVTTARTKTWENKSGATFQIDFSNGSAKGLADVQNICVALQQALKLPDACTVTAKRSGRQGSCLIDIMFFNDMQTLYAFPEQWVQRSGRDPFSIGLCGDKTHAMVCLYQDSMIVVGKRGGGKSVFLHTVTAWMMQCVDVIVWHADLNGGAISAPWMYLTASGEIDGHPIDWVAHNAEEALWMAEAAERIAKKRKTAYARLLMEKRTDKLPISPSIPMILIIVDEGGEVFGDDASPEAEEAAIRLKAVQRIGRAMCIQVIFSSQRGTADYVSAAMKKATNVKVALPVDDDAELAHLFDWKRNISSDDLLYPGCAYLKNSATGPGISMIKTLFTTPDTITNCVKATYQWRPELDPISAAEIAEFYDGRWTRPSTVEWMATIGAGAGTSSAATMTAEQPPAPVVAGPPPPADPPAMEARAGGSFAQTMAGLDALLNANEPGEPKPFAGDGQPVAGAHDRVAQVVNLVKNMGADEVLQELAGMFAAEYEPAGTPPAPGGPPDQPGAPGEASAASGAEWTYRFVESHGRTPVKTQDIVAAAIAQGLTTRRQTVSGWVGNLLADGKIVKIRMAHWVADVHSGPEA